MCVKTRRGGHQLAVCYRVLIWRCDVVSRGGRCDVSEGAVWRSHLLLLLLLGDEWNKLSTAVVDVYLAR